MTYWTNFAKTGNPNGEGLPTWEPYDNRELVMRLTTEGSAMADLDTDGTLKQREEALLELLK